MNKSKITSADVQHIIDENAHMFLDLNRYKKIKQIGKGAFAVVYLCQDIKTKKKVAVKMLKETVEEKNSSYFLREVSTMMNIDHPFHVKFLGYSEGPPLSIISEYIPCGSLYKFRSDPNNLSLLTPTKRTIIAMGIAHAMMNLHKLGIIHRDLKSMNILLDEDLYPKICDFGVSMFLADEYYTLYVGTPNWMAPEIHMEKEYGAEVDVYSYAMILYELVTDEIPFKGLSSGAILKKVAIAKQRPGFTRDGDDRIKTLIRRCWKGDPRYRPSFKEIYNYFANGKVYFDGTDMNEVKELAEKLKKWEKDRSWNGKKVNGNNSTNVISSSEEYNYDFVSAGKSGPPSGKRINLTILSDPNNSAFSSEMRKVPQLITEDQIEDFFKVAMKYLRRDSDSKTRKYVLKCFEKILHIRECFNHFLDKRYFLYLPLNSHSLSKRSLDIYHRIFLNKPGVIDDSFKNKFTEIVNTNPFYALVLMQLHTQQQFKRIPKQLFNVLFQQKDQFIDDQCSQMLLKTYYQLYTHYNNYYLEHKDLINEISLECLKLENIKIAMRGYYLLSLTYDNKYNHLIDYGVVTDHLQIKDLQLYVLSFLIKVDNKLPSSQELLFALLEVAQESEDANKLILKNMDDIKFARILLKKSKWMKYDLPAFKDTIDIMFAVMKHEEIAEKLGSAKDFPRFMRKLCNDQDFLDHTCTILHKTDLDFKIVENLEKEGVIQNFVQASLKNTDEKLERKILYTLYMMGEIRFSPSFNNYINKLKEIVLKNNISASNAIALASVLSRYKQCMDSLINNGFHKLFRKLLEDDDYKDDAVFFMDNYEKYSN